MKLPTYQNTWLARQSVGQVKPMSLESAQDLICIKGTKVSQPRILFSAGFGKTQVLTSQPTGFGESLGSVPRACFSLGGTSDLLPSVRVGMTPVLSPQPTGVDVIVSFPLTIPKMIPLSVSYLCRRKLIGVSACLIQIQLCTRGLCPEVSLSFCY